MNVDEIEDNVMRGAEFLDLKVPGWWERVELEKLVMSSCLNCVLGQLFGAYDKGMTHLLSHKLDAVSLGFSQNDGDDCVWEELEWQWRIVILGRREQALILLK